MEKRRSVRGVSAALARGSAPVIFATVMILGVTVWALQAIGAVTQARKEGKTAPERIQARGFVVVDETGKERAEFGPLPEGGHGFIARNVASGAAASIGIDDAGMPRLALMNGKGEALLEVGIGEKDVPVFFMNGSDGNRRLGFVVTDAGSVGIGLYDASKRERCMVAMSPNGTPHISLSDDQGRRRAILTVDGKGTAALALLDQNRAERIVFQVDTNANADGAVFAADGTAQWSASKK